MWTIDSLAGDDARGARADSDQLVAARALHAVRDRRDVHLGSRILRQYDSARLFLAMRALAQKIAMEHGHTALSSIVWFLGWAVAVALLFFAGLRLPLQTHLTRGKSLLFNAGVILVALGLTALANVALVLHDAYIDLTREKVFTPSAQAMAVVDQLQQPVRLTYFYRGQDRNGRRLKEVLEVMGRRNALLQVRTVDPDREPSIAQAYGMRNVQRGNPGSRRTQARSPDHRRERNCHRHPASAARESHHRLLPRRARRVSDGQFRVPHSRRRRGWTHSR